MSDIGEATGLFRGGAEFAVPDEESISTCPLLTPSPTVEFQHPLALPTTPVMFERRMSPCSLDTEASSCPPAEESTADIAAASSHKSSIPSEIDASLGEQSDRRDGSSSSSSSVAQDTAASTQLLNSRNYLTLASDVNCQENGGIKPSLVGLALSKTTQEYGFTQWNWPVIRKWCFWGVMSITVACICVIIGYITTIPTRCDPPRAWHQGTLIYQVFPASFQDSDANGIGDIKGVTSRVEYVKSLGAKGIRLSYVFPAQHYPEHFNRVENLTRIDPSIGTVEDFRDMVEAFHQKNISVVLDLPLYPFFEELKIHDPLSETHGKETVKHVIVNNHILVSPINRTSSWGTSRGLVTDVLAFWLDLGVDGFYMIGLQHFINDENFLNQIHEWRAELYKFDHGFDKVLICAEEVVKNLQELTIIDRHVKLNAVLKIFDLVDVRLDPFTKGTKTFKTQLDSLQKGVIYSKPGYPWVYWTLGDVDTHRLASKAPYGNVSMAVILTSMMLPGTAGLFYGDELGLLDIHDPDGERADLEHAHGLGPMQWIGSRGFTHGSLLSWLPKPKATLPPSAKEFIAKMSQIRDSNPPIYMHALWSNNKLIPNSAIRYVDNNLVTIERSYSRRHTYLLIANLGSEKITKDLSTIYYGGYIVLDTLDESVRYLTFQSLTMVPGQVIVARLDK